LPDPITGTGRTRHGATRGGAGGRRSKAAAWIFPRRRAVRLYCSIGPTPLTIRREVLARLNRDPICARSQHGRGSQGYLEYAGGVNVGLIHRAVNQRPRQAAAICVEEHVERSGRARSIEIYALRVHFTDSPSLACGHDEIVSGKVGISGKVRELLRRGAEHTRVV
jgi:hypothetical protein